jgi:DNA repair exonuclease SbcCD ATPase subunit
VLKAKQGSSQQYSSQAERDAHLKKHIKQLKQAATGQEDQLQSLRSQEEELGTALNDLASVSTYLPAAVGPHQGPWPAQADVEQCLV